MRNSGLRLLNSMRSKSTLPLDWARFNKSWAESVKTRGSLQSLLAFLRGLLVS